MNIITSMAIKEHPFIYQSSTFSCIFFLLLKYLQEYVKSYTKMVDAYLCQLPHAWHIDIFKEKVEEYQYFWLYLYILRWQGKQ